MCLVIDTSCFSKIFNKRDKESRRFQPVLAWITTGDGFIVYGGTKYKKELNKARRYLGIFVELNKQGRIIELPDAEVDKIAEELKRIVDHRDFDDEHLVAIVSVSHCRVVCTDDVRAEKYLKKSSLYPKGVKRPKIYKNSRYHTLLCCRENIVGICRERLDRQR